MASAISCLTPMIMEDTITAIATPAGQGGIGIVRVSGPKAKSVLSNLWTNKTQSVDKMERGRLYYGSIGDLDCGLVVWFQAPHSYTGEDVVEFHCHGSPLVLEKLLQHCVEAGARLARPGEFTKRAYLNGKLDLAQAESVADLIAASSEAGLKAASEQLEGRLSSVVGELQQAVLTLRAFVEAAIDFPEEDIELIQREGIGQRLQEIKMTLDQLIASYAAGKVYRDGVTVVLAGRPNVGKSSLFNALLGVDRAIVHEEPGTTRDALEEAITIDGILFRLLDVAGLHNARGAVEKMGVERALAWCAEADLILWVIDRSELPTDEDLFLRQRLDATKTVIGFSKADLPHHGLSGWLEGAWAHVPQLPFSSLTGVGLPGLRKQLVSFARKGAPKEGEGVVITTLRHKQSLEKAKNELILVKNGIENGVSSEFLAENLKKANDFLGQITGGVTTEDLLDQIFSRFCIGK